MFVILFDLLTQNLHHYYHHINFHTLFSLFCKGTEDIPRGGQEAPERDPRGTLRPQEAPRLAPKPAPKDRPPDRPERPQDHPKKL